MELQLPPLQALFTFTLLLLLTVVLIRKKGSKPGTGNLPPSPWKLPIIGNIHHLLGETPHRVIRNLSSKHGPIIHLKLGEVDHIMINSRSAATEIMKTHDLNFASRPQLLATTVICYGNRGIAFAPYGAYWRQLRKICALELLSSHRVKAISRLRDEEISNLVREIERSTTTGEVINVTERLQLYANTVTSRAAFGEECRHTKRFVPAVKRGSELASGFVLVDLFPSVAGVIDALTGVSSKLERIHRELDGILDEIIEDHRTKRGVDRSGVDGGRGEDDLVDVLLSFKEDERDVDLSWSDVNIKAVILDVFIGGTDASSTTLIWAMSELMRHPDVMKRAQEEVRRALVGKSKIDDTDITELHYTKTVIKETLRLHPPLPLLLPRVCNETCEIGGYRIPSGSRVIINAWAIARDPTDWDDGESFKPERFDGRRASDYKGDEYDYMPFGMGRRACPGVLFGMTNVEIALARLLLHFDWELPGGMKPEELDMSESFGATVGRRTDMYLIATPV